MFFFFAIASECIFNRENSPTYFTLARDSFIRWHNRSHKHPHALICVYNRIGRTQLAKHLFSDSKVSGMIARKTSSLHVHVFGLRPVCVINFLRDQSSDKLINFLDSKLETRSSILETRYSKLSRIEDRISRIEAQGTVNLLLSGTVKEEYVYIHVHSHGIARNKILTY